MARAAFLVGIIAFGPAIPESCGRLSGKGAQPSATTTAQPPAPPSLPVTSSTTPPVWAPPDPGGPLPSALPVSPDLAKARAFAQAGDSKKVRALLEKKVKGGKGSREEATLLLDACAALRDKACVEAVKAKHPEVAAP
jgi:hypothetical protein